MITEKRTVPTTPTVSRLPLWASGLLPILALGLMLLLFSATNPLALFKSSLPPVEQLSFERVRVVQGGFQVTLVNSGPDPVTVAQVAVDDAYWTFTIQPARQIPRMGRAVLDIPYPWVANEPAAIRVVTSSGLTFEKEIGLATLSPNPGLREFLAYGLVGLYVGVIPVGLGLLWYPALKRLGRRWLGALLALTIGLLVFLLIDTFLEAIEAGGALPGVFQGVPLALFAALLTWLAIKALSSQGAKDAQGQAKERSPLVLSGLIALSIGLHNLGEGLAVGAAFALGEAALGSFLVIGFILHNITEGIGIAAPLVQSRRAGQTEVSPPPRAGLAAFGGLALLAGFPAVIGAWIGGFTFSPILAVLFLGVGMGAILQVVVEVAGLLRRYAERDRGSWISWPNLAGFVAGLALMYFTAFLVKF